MDGVSTIVSTCPQFGEPPRAIEIVPLHRLLPVADETFAAFQGQSRNREIVL